METTQKKIEDLQLVIDGKTVTVKDAPELQAFISEVRSIVTAQEKKKLYHEIENLKNSFESLKNVNPDDLPTIAEQRIAGLEQRLLAGLQTAIEQKIQPLLEKTAKLESMDIARYRNHLLEQNQGKCIPELVVGETKEQLDAALQNSLLLFQRYVDKNGTPTPTPTNTPATPESTTPNPATPKPATPASAPPPAPASSNLPANPSIELPNIKEMSLEEYSRHRNQIGQKVETLLKEQYS